MEQDLDKIAKGETEYHELCRRVNNLIDTTIKSRDLDKNNKLSIKIDENHTYIIGKNGPVIKCNIDKKTTFKSIKPELINKIDMERLKNGGYNLEEIVDMEAINNISIPKNYLGKYDEQDVYIKSGKYGAYIEWGNNRKSMNAIDKAIVEITIKDAIDVIENRLSSGFSQTFLKFRLNISQILLTLEDTEERRRSINAKRTFENLFELDYIPVVNENDTIATSEIKYGDNDRLASRVAQITNADTLILLSDVDGLFTKNPKLFKDAKLIKKVIDLDKDMEITLTSKVQQNSAKEE